MKSNKLKILVLASLCAASLAEAGDFKWSNVSMGGGGFVSSIVASPVEQNLFYARTDVGGAYRWDEGSLQWVSMMDWVDKSELGLLGVEALAVDPKDPETVYMMAGTSYWNYGRTAFLRSKDKGVSWEAVYTWDTTGAKGKAIANFWAHGNGMGRGNGEALAVDPNNSSILFYGSKNKGLFKSTTNGDSWVHVDGFTAAAGSDTTWNGSGFSFVAFAPGNSSVMYAGFLREGSTASGSFENVFTSADGGASWKALSIPDALRKTSGGSIVRLMPQRLAITPDGASLFITFSDGAGPHTMAWDEGWGFIDDGFGRGAVLKYDVASKAWSDISPEDYLDYGNPAGSKYDNVDIAGIRTSGCTGDACEKYYPYAAPYGGVSVNPANPKEIVITSEGYTGAQYWKVGTAWKDQWGTQIFYSNDGGATWIQSFRYESGTPAFGHMDENGIGWMLNSSIHWSGSVAFDPFDSKRVWVSSGNGIFRTDDITAYTLPENAYTIAGNRWDPWTVDNRQVWKVSSHGIEETVPEEVVSIPGGPLVSVIADYDGFRHDDIRQFPSSRHITNLSGASVPMGSTRALAYAYKSGTLVKVADARNYVDKKTYTNITSFDPIQISNDSGSTWEAFNGYSSSIPLTDKKGTVAISTDGSVVLWSPGEGSLVVKRFENQAWTDVKGIDGAFVVGDPENASVFYAYVKGSGKFFRSADKGKSFSEVSVPGVSEFKKFRVIPGREGDIWLPVVNKDASGAVTGKLLRSTDGGKNFAAVSGVAYAEAVGFGKSASEGGYPAIYMYGKVGDVEGVFQSDDQGAKWTRVNDDSHEYGGLANGEFVMGDMNTYGVVYMSTAGRGVAARVPADWDMNSSTPGSVTPVQPALALDAGSASLERGTLRLSVSSGAPLRVSVYGLNGARLYGQSFASSTELPLNGLLPAQGLYLLQVRQGSTVLLSRTVSRMR